MSSPRALAFVLWLAGLVACGRAEPAQLAPQVPTASLEVGTAEDYPPFSVRAGDGFSGFSIALIERYARDNAVRAAWRVFRWPELVSDLQAGKFELASSGITVRPERSIAGRYSLPVARTGSVLLLRRPALVATLPSELPAALAELDRPELRVGVNRGGHLERVARRTFARAQIITFPDNALVPQALAHGELDAALTNTVEAGRWAALAPGAEPLGPFTREDVALFLRAERTDLADALDDWLLAREADGTLAQLRAEHLGAAAAAQTAQVLPALLAATAERLAVMPFVGAAKQRANKPIDDPEQERRVLASEADVADMARALHVAAPPVAQVQEFLRAQMEAAKAVQRLPRESEVALYSLEGELRPAIARITHRMHRLLVRLPPELELADVERATWSQLADSGLDREHSAALARSIVALSRREP